MVGDSKLNLPEEHFPSSHLGPKYSFVSVCVCLCVWVVKVVKF